MDGQCSCVAISRRDFLKFAGGAAACCALTGASGAAFAADPISRTPLFAKSKARVGLVFSHIPTGNPTWPSKDYDYAARAKELTARLQEARPSIDFVARTAHNADMANAILKEVADVDGYVVYALGIWTQVPDTIMRGGKPVVLVDDLFAGSGEVLIVNGVARREKLPVVTVSSSDFADVAAAVRLFEVIRAMKETTILDVADYDIAGATDQVKKVYGSKVVRIGSEELASYYERADEREAAEWADLWVRQAKKVVEPTREELVKSGKMYLALSRAASEKRADAAPMDCLSLFYSGRAPSYPCLSHFQMNNDGARRALARATSTPPARSF